ncbi:MAG: ferritin-like domain-containing protein [Cellulosilyticum sp.]|nr:ferritin-like domain-containing protein [Cellulosilyticum sp.]
MSLNQKEESLIKDLQEQEKLCIQKYTRYEQQAHDVELKNLFDTLRENEINHYEALEALKNNETEKPEINHLDAANYCPKSTYTKEMNNREKEDDAYFCTDSIATEKFISTSYNNDLFQFASTEVRDTLNQIQTDEQNHAEMIYKYKTANGMA